MNVNIYRTRIIHMYVSSAPALMNAVCILDISRTLSVSNHNLLNIVSISFCLWRP